jgi:hypothetical protein
LGQDEDGAEGEGLFSVGTPHSASFFRAIDGFDGGHSVAALIASDGRHTSVLAVDVETGDTERVMLSVQPAVSVAAGDNAIAVVTQEPYHRFGLTFTCKEKDGRWKKTDLLGSDWLTKPHTLRLMQDGKRVAYFTGRCAYFVDVETRMRTRVELGFDIVPRYKDRTIGICCVTELEGGSCIMVDSNLRLLEIVGDRVQVGYGGHGPVATHSLGTYDLIPKSVVPLSAGAGLLVQVSDGRIVALRK